MYKVYLWFYITNTDFIIRDVHNNEHVTDNVHAAHTS